MPGWAIFRRVNRDRVPFNAVIAVSVASLIIAIPALFGKNDIPFAFFALTGICTVGLYLAYIIPVYLRLRKGDDFEPGPWNLGRRYRLVNTLAIVFVVAGRVRLDLPYTPAGLPWNDDFDASLVNYTPLAILLPLIFGVWYLVSAKDRYQGPVRTLEEDEVTRGRLERARARPALGCSTNSRQRRRARLVGARRRRAAGSTRRSTGSSSAASSSEPITPAPTAASAAAPATVASAPPASTGTPIASAWSWSISGSFVRPPSTRSAVDVDALAHRGDDVGHPPGDPLERGAGDVRPRRAAAACPASTARASGFHHGAPMPASPGSTRAPPASSASRASSPSAGGSSATPSSAHIHSSIAPAANTPPSIAYSMLPSMLQATVGSRPPAGCGTSSPTWARTNTPVP